MKSKVAAVAMTTVVLVEDMTSTATGSLDILAEDPFATPPRDERLVGDLASCYSRQINVQHRLVYEVLLEERVVHVLRMWTHDE